MGTQTNLTTAKPMSLDQVKTILRSRLEDEARILDTLVAEASAGRPQPDVWRSLHEAAARDDLLPEVAFAYEQLARSKRLKAAPAEVQADALMNAARFFSDVFGDAEGASEFLERIVVIQPDHPEAIPQLERLLIAAQNWPALADLYERTAPVRADPKEQIALLTRAAELLDRDPAEAPRVTKLYEKLLEIDPNQPRVRRTLETRYLLAGQPAEAAAFVERVLASDVPNDDAEIFGMRTRLMGLYAGELDDIERTLPHIRELLVRDPHHEKARAVATQLLERPTTRGAAAEILADVFRALGSPREAADMLELRLADLVGPARAPLEARLAVARHELGDLPDAYTLLEAVILRDPSDDDARRRYREVAASLDRRGPAADTYALLVASTDNPVLRGALSQELAHLLLEGGDGARAKAALQEIVDLGGDDAAVLGAARQLVGLYAAAGEHGQLAPILELLATRETEADERDAAQAQLAKLLDDELGDVPRAIEAYKKTLDGPRRAAGLAALERIYERVGLQEELAAILDARGAMSEGDAARDFAFRAADIRARRGPAVGDGADTHAGTEASHALDVWRAFSSAHGPTRAAHARIIPLLEGEALWVELAEVLTREIELTPMLERAPVFAALSAVCLQRLSDPARAAELIREAVQLDEASRDARPVLEQLLAVPEHRLMAAEALEAAYRTDGTSADLARVLEIKGELALKPSVRLGAYEEAVTLAERDLADPQRALDLAGRALAEAVAREPKRITSWLDRVERLASTADDAAKKARLLVAALGDRAVDGKAMSRLARRAGAALEAVGEAEPAIATYQRSLAFEPSPELEKRVQKLVLERKTPDERVAVLREDLERTTDPERRRELFGMLAAIHRDERGDPASAIGAWSELLAEMPGEVGALEALLAAHTAAGDDAARVDVAKRLAVLKQGTTDDLAGAFTLLETVVDARPEDGDARARLTTVAGALDRRQDAAQVLENAVARAGAAALAAAIRHELADVLLEMGDTQGAREALTAIVDRRPTLPPPPIEDEEIGLIEIAPTDDEVPQEIVLSAARSLSAILAIDVDRDRLVSLLELRSRIEPTPAERLAVADQRAALAVSTAEAADFWAEFAKSHDDRAATLARRMPLLEGAGRWGDVADLLEESAAHESGEAAAELLGRAAQVRVQLGEMVRALSLYGRALALAPREARSRAALAELLAAGDFRAEAADVLEPTARAEGDAELLAQILSVRATAARDSASRLVAIEEALGVLSGGPDDARRALDLAVLGLRLAPTEARGAWVDRIETIAARVDPAAGGSASGDAAGRAAVLDAALGGAELDTPEMARLARMTAEALEAAGDLDRALALYQRVLVAQPSSLELKVRVYGVMMNRAEQTLGSREAAVAHVTKQVLELPPDQMDGALAIALLLPPIDGVEGTLGHLRALAARSEGALKIALDVIAAEVLLDRLQRHDEALDLLEELLTTHAGDRAPLAVLQRALSIDATRDRAVEIALRAAAAARKPERAVALLERLVFAQPAGAGRSAAGDHAALVAWWEELLDRQEPRPEVALGVTVRAALQLPDEDSLWDRAERLARFVDHPDPLADAYTKVVDGPTEEAAQRELVIKVGRRAVDFFEEFYDDDRPLRLLSKLLKIDEEWAFERLKLTLSTSSRWDDLFGLYDQRLAEAKDDDARAQVLEEAAEVARDFAGDAPRAIGYLERLAALQPESARVDAALERLYERESLRPQLIRLLSARLGALSGNDAQLLRARVAGLWLDTGDDVEGFSRVEEMLALEPDRDDAFELLERIALRPDGAQEPQRPLTVDLLRRAAGLLRARYEARGLTPELVRAVTVELHTAGTDAERIQRRRELADLKLRLGDHAATFDDVAALVALEPEDEAHVEHLEGLAARLDAFQRFLEILVSAASSAPRPRDRARLIARAGLVARDRLSDAMTAIDLFTRVLEIAQDDPQRLLSTARELEPLLNVAGMDAERCSVLETIARLETEPAARREAFGQVARIAADLLKDDARAVAAWRARLADDPNDREALDGIAVVLEASKRWPELIDVLDRRASIASKQQAKADRIAIAKIHLTELGAVADGTAAWQSVRDIFGPDEENFEALSALLTSESRFGDLAKLLEHHARSVGDPARVVELWGRLGDLSRDKIGAVAAAAAAYREALLLSPGDANARAGLQALLADAEVRGDAIDALSRSFAATSDWEAASALARDLAPGEDVPRDLARSFWWGVAVFQRDAASDPDSAEWAFGHALAHDPESDEILTSLAAVQRRAPGHALVDTLVRLSDVKGGDLDLLQEAAEIAIAPLADRPLAIANCEKLLDLAVARWTGAAAPSPTGGSNREKKKRKLAELVDGRGAPGKTGDTRSPRTVATWAISELVRMGLEADESARVVALYKRGASLPFDRAETRRMRHEAALLCEQRLGDADAAIGLYHELFAEDAADDVAQASVDTFARLLEAGKRNDDVVALWEQQAKCRADAGDAEQAALLWARAAELSETCLGDEARAIADHDRGAALGGVASLEALARIHGARNEHARAADALERLCQRAAPEALAEGTQRLAEAYVLAGDRATARARLERAQDAEGPGGVALRARLAELYREDELWDPLAALYTAEAGRTEGDARLAFLRQGIDLHIFKRHDPAAAIPLLEQTLALAPEDAVLGLTLGEALHTTARHADAIRVLEQQLERYGTRKPKERGLTHYALARAAAAAGDKARALEELDLAARIDRAHAGILHALGRLASELGELPRAARAFQALLLLRQAKDDGPAQRAYQELLELHRRPGAPRDGDVGRSELLLELADIAEREGDPVRAAEFLGSAAEAARSSPEEAARHERALLARTARAATP